MNSLESMVVDEFNINDTIVLPASASLPSEVIVNELLSYLTFNYNSRTATVLNNTISCFYTDEEIAQAKTTLWRLTVINVQISNKKRMGENKKFNETSDMINAIKKMDEQNSMSELPKFVAFDLNRLPKADSQESLSASVLARLTALEQNFNEVKSLAETNNNSISQIRSDQCKAMVSEPEVFLEGCLNSYAAAAASTSEPNKSRPPRKIRRVTSMRSESVGAESNNQQNKHGVDAGDPFKDVVRKKRPFIKGSNDSSALVGGPEITDIFISHLDKLTSKEKLTEFLTNNNVHVRDAVMVSNAEARFASFRVTIDASNYDIVCGDSASSFWPRNVYCRKFFHKRSDKTPGQFSGKL